MLRFLLRFGTFLGVSTWKELGMLPGMRTCSERLELLLPLEDEVAVFDSRITSNRTSFVDVISRDGSKETSLILV